MFNPCGRRLAAIVDIHVRRFNERLGSFEIELDDAARQHLARSGISLSLALDPCDGSFAELEIH